MPMYLPRLRQAAIAICSSFFTAVVALVEQLGDDGGVAIQAERELRHVVRADRHAVEVFEVLVREQRVGRQLAHHDDLQIVLAALQAIRGQQLGDRSRFLERAHERHHHLHVGQAHLVAHALQCAALELEAGAERFIDVARGAAEAEHRILFERLVLRGRR